LIAVGISISYTAEPSNHLDPKASTGGKKPGIEKEAKSEFIKFSP
jgi:hypothetical protein